MKKFLAGIAAAAIITVPMTSFALESMSKGALKKATGQAGVSIAVDNVVIYQSAPDTVYWDTDATAALDPSTGLVVADPKVGAAGILITDSAKLTRINAIADASNSNAPADAAGKTHQNEKYSQAKIQEVFGVGNAGIMSSLASGGTAIKALSIDVGTCSALTQGLSYNIEALTGIASTDTLVVGVVIGLPTIEIQTSSSLKSISVIGTKDKAGSKTVGAYALVGNNDGDETTSFHGSNELISIQEGNKTMAILGGTLEIAPH